MPSRRSLLLLPWGLVACAPRGPAAMPPTSKSPLVGGPAPSFARPTLRGDRFDVASVRGKTVVIKFFARYCEPCKRTLPAVEALHRRRPEIVLLGISEDENEEQARGVVSEFGLTFPVVFDRDNVLSGRFRVSEMPATFVLDGAGVVRWFGAAERTEHDLVAAIEASS